MFVYSCHGFPQICTTDDQSLLRVQLDIMCFEVLRYKVVLTSQIGVSASHVSTARCSLHKSRCDQI